jgi:predicted ATPase
MLFVAGYSGIGKTSLIHELYNPIVRQGGHFVSGKFDQVVRNIPYGALTQALRNLVRQLLTQSEDELSKWRAQLSAVLGSNGGVLAEVIPEIELILGKQAPPPPLDPTEARNRFGHVFQSFVRIGWHLGLFIFPASRIKFGWLACFIHIHNNSIQSMTNCVIDLFLDSIR